MQQSPSLEVSRFSPSQTIPGILWNLTVHYRFHKCLPPVPALSQINQVHVSHPTSWRFFLVLSPSKPGSSKWSLSLRFPRRNPVRTSALHHTCYMPCPSHSSQFDHPNIFVEEYKWLGSSLCSSLHSSVTGTFLTNISIVFPSYLKVTAMLLGFVAYDRIITLQVCRWTC